MIQGILLFHFDFDIDSPFDLLKAIFSSEGYNENSYSDLIVENDIFRIFYQHTTGTSGREDNFNDTYIGRLNETPYQVFSYFRQLSDQSQFFTTFIFDLDDTIDNFIDTIDLMTKTLETFIIQHQRVSMKITNFTKQGKNIDKRTMEGRKFKVELEKIKEKNQKYLLSRTNPELSKLFEKTVSKIMNKNIKIFFSYSNKDSDYFHIPIISKTLLSYPEITKVIYFEKEKYENIFQFMNDNIEKCDVLLSFCSQNALSSEYISLEWQAALSKKKKVIPIFTKKEDLPALLAPLNGVKFEQNDLPMSIEKIYQTIQKALKQ